MSTYKKGAAPVRVSNPVAADVAAEANRREALASNTAHQHGVQAALNQFKENCQREFDDNIAALRKTALSRDVNRPGREAYDRCYKRLEGVAARLAEILDHPVQIPEWLPPVGHSERMVSIGAPRTVSTYHETKGMGPSGKGLPPPPIPGSAADWVTE